ncbi:MAG: hypothetical protein A3C00_02110 [Candidatus Jacksonbacteria bacterium RIFCSPHIGHO2_02_FULL_44_25]|nr:MAG: hypothetical protein A3C00_02110 [Candidatus Jacksonbacteria bacterium RIFCSPHIGHO2_02_FULL_44_25]
MQDTLVQSQRPSKKALEEECDRIKAILARRAKKDPQIAGNYVTEFPQTGNDIDDDVFEEEEYEVNLAIEQSLEKRLKRIEEDLANIASGTV